MAGDPEGAAGAGIPRDPNGAAEAGISRDPAGAAKESFDLIVVGGGIYGCMLTLESARRGLRPLLLERDDFGQHTSANSLGIVHGGLRYLQSLNLRRFAESVAERTWLLSSFPEHVHPFPFLMPLYGRGLRRPSVLRAALHANDLLSSGRNRGVEADRSIPPGRVLSPGEVRARFPGAPPAGLVGGALWHDAVMSQPQRIIMEVLRWAVARGAVAMNYVGVEAVDADGGRVRGVQARDEVSGRALEYRAPVVVSCAGPWVRDLAGRADRDIPGLFHPSLALNLILDCEPDFDVGVAVTSGRRGAGTYFLYPWEGRVLAGTYHAPWVGSRGGRDRTGRQELGEPGWSPHRDQPSPALVAEFVRGLQEAAPSLGISRERVLRVLWGRLPVVKEGTTRLATREVVHDHGRHGGPDGLFSVSGVKFTVARRVARRVLRHLSRRGFVPALSDPRDEPPPPSLPPSHQDILALLSSDPNAAAAVIRRVAESESVLHAEDLLLRRTDWGMLPATGNPLAAAVQDVVLGPARERRPLA